MIVVDYLSRNSGVDSADSFVNIASAGERLYTRFFHSPSPITEIPVGMTLNVWGRCLITNYCSS